MTIALASTDERRMMDAPPKYALIKWLGGTDKGKYTPDVPTEWIKDFNYDEYLATDPDDQESYIVEWHEGSEPLGGWPCYDGEIIQLSDRKAVLERLFKTLKGVASPNLKINHDEKHTNKASSQVLNDNPVLNDNSVLNDDPVLNDEDSERSSSSDSEDVDSTPSTQLDRAVPKPGKVNRPFKNVDVIVHAPMEQRLTKTSNNSNEKRQKNIVVQNVDHIEVLSTEQEMGETPACKGSVSQKQLDMNLSESDDTISQNGRIQDRNKSKRSREEPNLSTHVNKKVKGRSENQQSSIDAILNAVTSMQNQIDKLTNKENVLVNVNMSSSPSRNRDDEEHHLLW